MNSRPVKIEYDMKYENMYRLVWEDKIPSADMYNLTRANDILKNYDLYVANMNKSDSTWLSKRAFLKQK